MLLGRLWTLRRQNWVEEWATESEAGGLVVQPHFLLMLVSRV